MASRRVLFVIDIASGRESDVLPIDGDGDRRSEGNLTLFFLRIWPLEMKTAMRRRAVPHIENSLAVPTVSEQHILRREFDNEFLLFQVARRYT